MKARTTTKLLLVGVALALGSATACGGADKKSDKQVKAEQVSATALALGMKQKAVEAFQTAIDELKKPKPDTAKAVSALEASLAIEPEFCEAHYNLGLLYIQLGNGAGAQEHLEKARELDPEILDYTVALGRGYVLNERYDDAESLFSEVLAREPANLEARNNLAVLMLRQDKLEDALKHLQDVLKEDNENVNALNTLGLVYRKKGNMSLAKFVFKKAIKYDKKNPDVHNNLGLAYMAEKNVPAAVKEFNLAVDADPNYLESRLNLGAVLLEYLDYGRADEQFREAVRISPTHCVAKLGGAATAYALGKHADSADGYNFYVDNCDEKHISSLERLAKLYEGFLGDAKKSITYYQKLAEVTEDPDKKKGYNAMIQFLESQLKPKKQKTPAKEGAGEDAAAAPKTDG